MLKQVDPAKRKKQQILVVMLLVGLLIAIVTQPKPATTPPTTPFGGRATNASLSNAKPALATTVAPSSDHPDSSIDPKRFVRRELSRIDWDQAKSINLFRARPMEAALAGDFSSGRPMRVEAVYGALDSKNRTEERTSVAAQRSALIGAAIVRPGEPLPDGRKVLSVTADGVAVAPSGATDPKQSE